MSYGYARPASQEGTPIVCKNCGGAMRLQHDLSAICGFCGARDQLPVDEAARYLELKNRLSYARSRAAQVQGMDAALARIFEDRGAFLRVGGVYLGMGLVIFLMSLVSMLGSGAITDKVPENIRMSLWMHQLFAPMMMIGVAISLGLGLLGGRAHFRKRIRPQLLARPIQAGHAGFACRVCGAELAPGSDVSVTCRYCESVNLRPAHQHEASVSAVQQQADAMHRGVQHAHLSMASISSRMRTIVIAGMVVTFLIVYVVPGLLDKFVFYAQ